MTGLNVLHENAKCVGLHTEDRVDRIYLDTQHKSNTVHRKAFQQKHSAY